jgi:hypothetical protein
VRRYPFIVSEKEELVHLDFVGLRAMRFGFYSKGSKECGMINQNWREANDSGFKFAKLNRKIH